MLSPDLKFIIKNSYLKVGGKWLLKLQSKDFNIMTISEFMITFNIGLGQLLNLMTISREQRDPYKIRVFGPF
jgi:hypothetical protein